MLKRNVKMVGVLALLAALGMAVREADVVADLIEERAALPTAAPRLKISVFADAIQSLSRQREVSLERAAEMLYHLGVRGFDANVFGKNLDRLAATRIKPINFYYFPSFAGADGGVSENVRALSIAVRHGVKQIMTIPPNFTKGGVEETEFVRIKSCLTSFVQSAKASGITVTIEDFGGTQNACSHLKYLKRMLDEIPDLRMTIDSGNLYYAGRGEDILQLLSHAGKRVVHVHLKDQPKSDNRAYVTLGLGAVPNRQIVRDTWAGGYDGWYTLENPVGDVYEDTARQVNVLKAWLGGKE